MSMATEATMPFDSRQSTDFVRYADSGEEKASQALLFGPWPESLFAFHRVWPRLAELAQLIAIDLPGFGHSERRISADAATGPLHRSCR
jgi:pimeloyl-ACP methyl ester carboxylesterase